MTSNASIKKSAELLSKCKSCSKELDELDIKNSDNNLCYKCRYTEIGTSW